MGAKQSAETKHGMHLVTVEKMTVYEAAKQAGIYASTLYRAINPPKKKKKKKKKKA